MNNKNNDGCGCLLMALFIVLISAASIGLAYLVATSDMPDWLKFFLLR